MTWVQKKCFHHNTLLHQHLMRIKNGLLGVTKWPDIAKKNTSEELGNTPFLSWLVSSASEMHPAKASRQYRNNLIFTPMSSLCLPTPPTPPPTAQGCLPGRHVSASPYGLCLCHRGESILNKPSESFLCDTFHFPSSKLQGKLACQEDEREQTAQESKRVREWGWWEVVGGVVVVGEKKNEPTPTIKLTNHCS